MQHNQIPVLLLLFNRPDITEILIHKLREIKPKYLYIAQDWPRNIQEQKKTDQVKSCFDLIDRDCQVTYLIRDKNLWCYSAVVWWINRFFEYEEFWIILEDDCIPNESFFKLCTIANILYKNNKKIGLISWSNYQTHTKTSKNDFLFSRHTPLLWWWATWKDRRNLFKEKDLLKTKFERKEITLEKSGFIQKKAITKYMLWWYWDSDWYMVCYFNQLLTVVPKYNHVSNLWCVGIHNARPWKYHMLKQFEVWYDGVYNNLKIILNKQYDREILGFLKRMYIYWEIENILRTVWLYTLAKKIIIFIAKIFYRNKLK